MPFASSMQRQNSSDEMTLSLFTKPKKGTERSQSFAIKQKLIKRDCIE